uniref:Non-LTR retroelement reverse transcriptase n=1 Tax=Solanum tuberosum TaxID=4113 RepID=M1CNL3_SOLTU
MGNMTKWKVIQEINSNLVKLVKLKYPWINVIPNQWPQLVQYFEQYRPLIKSQVVIWRKPEIGWLKCNIDGACRGNPGERSAAFCIRDVDGNLVYVEAKRLWITNSIHAEARAIQGGIQHCIEQQRVSILIESDSLAIINMTEGKWEAPWEIRMEITSINFWRKKGLVHFSHILREGNALADFLANKVFNFAGTETVQYQNFQSLPSEARKLLNIDKQQLPQLRFSSYRNREPD